MTNPEVPEEEDVIAPATPGAEALPSTEDDDGSQETPQR
jgi:hypothetical protein